VKVPFEAAILFYQIRNLSQVSRLPLIRCLMSLLLNVSFLSGAINPVVVVDDASASSTCDRSGHCRVSMLQTFPPASP